MARSSRSKRELRNRRIRKEITEGIRRKQLEEVCQKLAENTGVIAGNSKAAIKKEEEEGIEMEPTVIGAEGEEVVTGAIVIDENTPIDSSMFRPTVIGGGDSDDVEMKTKSSTSTKSKKSTKARPGNKKGGKKAGGKKKGGIKRRK